MKLQKIEDKKLQPRVVANCPACPPPYNNTTYMHDLKCPTCDNATIVYCPNCKNHWQVKL